MTMTKIQPPKLSSDQYRNRNVQMNVRTTEEGKELAERLKAYLGVSLGEILEQLMMEKARELGIDIPGSGSESHTLQQIREAALEGDHATLMRLVSHAKGSVARSKGKP